MIEKLTIALTLENNQIKATCTELGLEGIAETMTQALSALEGKIDSAVAEMSKDQHQNQFIRQLYGGNGNEEEDGFDDWLRQARYDHFMERLIDAFCNAYPSVDRENPFVHMRIPHINWDDGDNYDLWQESQKKAYQGLISEGDRNLDWRNFIKAICAVKLQGHYKPQRPEVYQEWVEIGLPVLPYRKTLALTEKEINLLVGIGK